MEESEGPNNAQPSLTDPTYSHTGNKESNKEIW